MRRLVHFPPRACWNLALVRACTANSPHEALPAYRCTVAPHMRAIGNLHTSPHRKLNAAPQKRTAESPSPSRSFSDPQRTGTGSRLFSGPEDEPGRRPLRLRASFFLRSGSSGSTCDVAHVGTHPPRPQLAHSLCSLRPAHAREPLGVPSGALCRSRSASPHVPADV